MELTPDPTRRRPVEQPRGMRQCLCGHLLMHHDIDEYDGDGSDTCCVEGCNQVGCPGRGGPATWM